MRRKGRGKDGKDSRDGKDSKEGGVKKSPESQ